MSLWKIVVIIAAMCCGVYLRVAKYRRKNNDDDRKADIETLFDGEK